MFLKRKIGLLKKSACLCLFLIMGAFAVSLNAAEKAKIIVNDEAFIFRNQNFIPGEKYTPKELEKKIGKADGFSNKAKLLEFLYKDDGLTFGFDSKNHFCGLSFFLMKEGMNPVKIYDLEIKPEDTYTSIRKKIKALNITYNIYEQPETDHIIEMDIKSKKFGKINIVIICSRANQAVLFVSVLYVDIFND